MKIKKIYFVGITGVGMTSLALIAKEAGLEIGGSDSGEEFITNKTLDKANIKYFMGFADVNFKNFVKSTEKKEVLLITTGAHGGFNNIEVNYAKENGYRVITHGQAVGLFMNGEIFNRMNQKGVSIAGSHGKTTITAMFATFLSELGMDPSYSIGTSEIFPLGLPGHFGKGDFFITEADEYVSEANFDRKSKFLYQYPEIEVINNIDFDHPDFFKNILEIKKAFALFIENINNGGTIIYNGDDTILAEIINGYKNIKSISFGSSKKNNFYISNYREIGFGSTFEVFNKDILLGSFDLSIPGHHNAKNSLSAVAFLTEIGVSIKKIQQVLPLFKGSKRRMEQIGFTKGGAILMDDYAHHPKEIMTTLASLKSAFANKKIVCIFQPHTFSRTEALYDDFLSSFQNADYLILLPTFRSARESMPSSYLDEKLSDDFKKIKNNFFFSKDFDSVVEYVNSKFDTGSYIVITMGAGDVYKIILKLRNK